MSVTVTPITPILTMTAPTMQANEQEWITAEPRNIRIRDSVSGTSETGSL